MFPESLEKYLGGFASPGVTVIENVVVAECHGDDPRGSPVQMLHHVGSKRNVILSKAYGAAFESADKRAHPFNSS
jgi:hypothetical protein